MLKKLLRYDLNSIFKFWWIAAVTAFATSILGGGCISALRAEPPAAITALAVAGLVLIIFCNCAFFILTEILVFLRYFRNFYTDEGYLTFTLPVKQSTLLHSKILMGFLSMVATGAVLNLNGIAMLSVGGVFHQEFWKEFHRIISELWSELGLYLPLYLLEIFMIFLALSLLSMLIIYFCISFSAIMVKKAKVFCAIALIYGFSGITAFLLQLFATLNFSGAFAFFQRLSEEAAKPFVAVLLLDAILFLLMLSSLAYLLLYRMHDRKLNLA